MKKLLKIMAIAISAIVMATCFIACGDKEEKHAPLGYIRVQESSTTYKRATEVDVQGYTIVMQTGDYLVLYKYVTDEGPAYYKYVLYDVVTDKHVATVKTQYYGSPFNIIDEIAVDTSTENDATAPGVTIYYKAKGIFVRGAFSAQVKKNFGLISANGRYFRIKSDSLEEFYPAVKTLSVSAIRYAAGGYYYVINDSNVLVYDSNLNIKGKISVDMDASGSVGVLSNGKLFTQEIIEGTKDDYDVKITGEDEYLKIKARLYNPADGTTKNLDLDYLVLQVMTAEMVKEDSGIILDGVDNIGMGLKIQDKTINTSGNIEENFCMLKISNEFEITEQEMIHPAQLTSTIMPFAPNRYALPLADGSTLIVNQYAETIVQVADFDIDDVTNDYFLADDKIYNMDGKIVVDLDADDYEVEKTFDTNIILSKETSFEKTTEGGTAIVKETTYYLLKDSKLNVIAKQTTDPDITKQSALYQGYSVPYNTYVIVETTTGESALTTYTLFGQDGDQLLNFKNYASTTENPHPDKLTWLMYSFNTDDYAIVRATINVYDQATGSYHEQYKYYRIAK
ncbi:MAG: hypothetical protein IJC07_02490 [Clostridia bacterium]|nr:hypothetical protein [Clostridia bacterium]